jgi:hypothetical protein
MMWQRPSKVFSEIARLLGHLSHSRGYASTLKPDPQCHQKRYLDGARTSILGSQSANGRNPRSRFRRLSDERNSMVGS